MAHSGHQSSGPVVSRYPHAGQIKIRGPLGNEGTTLSFEPFDGSILAFELDAAPDAGRFPLFDGGVVALLLDGATAADDSGDLFALLPDRFSFSVVAVEDVGVDALAGCSGPPLVTSGKRTNILRAGMG